MLFLLKRTWGSALLGLLVLVVLGLSLRAGLSAGPPFAPSVYHVAIGLGVFVVVLASDILLHTLFSRLFGDAYRRRHRELVELFRGQTVATMLAGAAMAGIGEELLFRGLSTDPIYLSVAAVVFGLLHHVRRALWPFTLWAIYEGLLFAGALYLTGALLVPMVAHFLHDLAGFLIFRALNRRGLSG
jgi:membrane protease YdiL (CAAX protease family)